MAKAIQRPVRVRACTAHATQRPWVKPAEGRTKTRRVNRDGSVTVFTVDIDKHGVIRRSSTTVVPT